ncbi:MAG: nicotinate-nicotinamide nucleotide adenylyltransferase [Anaerolineales bacterium]
MNTDRCHLLVFGLSANPVHEGHVALVTETVRALTGRGYRLAGALLLPTYRRNPVGSAKERLPRTFDHRFAMCRLGAQEIRRRLERPAVAVRASRIEKWLVRDSTEPNYTVETLAALDRLTSDECELLFLMSADLFAGEEPEFARWVEPERIARLATLALAPRPGYTRNEAYVRHLEAEGGQVLTLDEVETPAVSGTEIRRQLQAGADPLALADEGLLPRSVAAYLIENPLYREWATEEA